VSALIYAGNLDPRVSNERAPQRLHTRKYKAYTQGPRRTKLIESKAKSISYSIVFFSHNKLINNTFYCNLSVKRTRKVQHAKFTRDLNPLSSPRIYLAAL